MLSTYTARMDFALIAAAGILALILILVGIGKWYPGSGADALGLELCQLLEVDLADARGGDRLRRLDLLDREARLVLVEVLAHQPRLVVVRPDERLPARHVVELLIVLDVVADGLQVGALGELVEGDLVGHSPIADREAVVGVPEHRLTHAVVEGEHAVLAGDHGGSF